MHSVSLKIFLGRSEKIILFSPIAVIFKLTCYFSLSFLYLLNDLECAQVSKIWVAFLFYSQRGLTLERRAWHHGPGIPHLVHVSPGGPVTAEHTAAECPAPVQCRLCVPPYHISHAQVRVNGESLWWAHRENKDIEMKKLKLLLWEAVGLSDKETAQNWQSRRGEKAVSTSCCVKTQGELPYIHPIRSPSTSGEIWNRMGFSSQTCINLFHKHTTVWHMTSQLCEYLAPCSGCRQIWKALLLSVCHWGTPWLSEVLTLLSENPQATWSCCLS